MMLTENPVHFQLPVLEDTFGPFEIHQLLSLLESEPTIIHPTSGSEERKRRRMISNRESARRSRCRKKKYQEDLTDEADRLKLQNRELENRLSVLTHHCHLVQRDSNRLLSESIYLQHKLTGLHELLASPTPLIMINLKQQHITAQTNT